MERKAPPKPRRAKAAGTAESPARPKAPPQKPKVDQAPSSPIGWSQAARAGLVVSLAGLAAAAIAIHTAGHAPSWRSLRALVVMAAPLFPAMTVLWLLAGVLRARHARLPLALWAGLVALGTVGVMFASSGLAFALVTQARGFIHDREVMDHLWGVAAAFYLFATTAFRLWWPWGAALPLLAAVLFWRDARA